MPKNNSNTQNILTPAEVSRVFSTRQLRKKKNDIGAIMAGKITTESFNFPLRPISSQLPKGSQVVGLPN